MVTYGYIFEIKIIILRLGKDRKLNLATLHTMISGGLR